MTDHPVTLNDLDDVRYLEDDWTDDVVLCRRCVCLVPEVFRGEHRGWHTAIEAASQGFTITMQGRTVEITEEFIAEALTNEGARRLARQLDQPEQKASTAPNWTTTQPHTGPDIHVDPAVTDMDTPFGRPSGLAPVDPGELREWLIGHLTSWYWGRVVTADAAHLARNAMAAFEACGIWPGELNRLRRIETALVELGAPNRSDPGDPGGLMIEWARELVAENKLLRDERDRFATELEAARGEDTL